MAIDKATEILINAKEILESEVEWCQFSLVNEVEGKIISVCTLGALDLAASRMFGIPLAHWQTDEHLEVLNEAEKRLISHIPCGGIASYNDDPGTSKEDVLLMFKKAIGGDVNHGVPL